MEEKIVLDKVIERFQEDKEQSSWVLMGLDSRDKFLEKVSKPFFDKLQKLHDPAVHGPEEEFLDKGPYPPKILEAFDLDPEIVEDEIKHKIKKEWEMTIDKLDTNELTKDAQEAVNKSEGITDSLKQIKTMVTNFAPSMISEISRLQKYNPKDDIVFVVRILRRHDGDKVSPIRFWATYIFFIRNKKAKLRGKLRVLSKDL